MNLEPLNTTSIADATNMSHANRNPVAKKSFHSSRSFDRLKHVKALALTETKKSDDLNARLKVMLPETQIRWMR